MTQEQPEHMWGVFTIGEISRKETLSTIESTQSAAILRFMQERGMTRAQWEKSVKEGRFVCRKIN